jgi:Kdo2-lipid IVA lauroyltransferase/acyltransferase
MNPTLNIYDKIKLFPLWVVSLLPLRLLYFVSDFFYYVVYYVVRYRKKVVVQNINMAFPDKSEKERLIIIKKFYRYFCDYFFESIYMLNMSAEECHKRYTYVNVEVLEKFSKEGKSIIMANSHYGNWEWAANSWEDSPFKIYGIYKPLSSPLFNKLFVYMRSKYNSLPIPMKYTLRVIIDSLKNNNVFMLYLVGDQRPNIEDLSYWTTFLNQEAPVITGIEKLAKKFNFPVFFVDLERVKRGYYKVIFHEIAINPVNTKQFEITEKYIRKVEELINKRPEFWLWSHKRWKYNPEIYKPKLSV